MPATETITVTLSPQALEIARARVASGEFRTESEVITQALFASALPPLAWSETKDSFLAECTLRYDRMRENPHRGLTLDQAFQDLDT